MPNVIPRFADNIIITPPILLGGSLYVYRSTLDLRDCYSAIIFVDIAKGIQSQPRTSPVIFQARRMVSTAQNQKIIHPSGIMKFGTITPHSSILLTRNVVSGENILTVVSTSNLQNGDMCAIYNTSNPSDTFEAVAIRRVINATQILLDAPLQLNHTTSEYLFNKLDSFPPFQVMGGADWEFIFDIGSETTDAKSVIRCMAQKYYGDITI